MSETNDPIREAVQEKIAAKLRHLADKLDANEPTSVMLAYVDPETNGYETFIQALPHDAVIMLLDLERAVKDARATDAIGRRTGSYQGQVAHQQKILHEVLNKLEALEGRIDGLTKAG